MGHFDIAVLPNLPTATEIGAKYKLIVDAIFGYSYRPPARSPFDKAMVDLVQSGLPIASIDIPSGGCKFLITST